MADPVAASVRPWQLGNAVSLLTFNTVGLVLVLAGWYVAAGRLLMHAQVAGANVAVAGIVVAGAGNAMWLLTGRRALGLRRRTVARVIERQYRSLPRPVTEQTATLVAASGMTRYHRRDCAFAAARPVAARRRETHEAQGRTPCEVCRP